MKNWANGLFVVGGWVFWQVVGPVGQVSWVVQVVGQVSLGVVGEVVGVFLWLLGEAVGVS